MYIKGVGMGYACANVDNKINGLPPLYCPPVNLGVTVENYLDIIDRYIERHKNIKGENPESFIELLLLKGLKETFPCK
jgi:hypothetical protein